MARSNSYRSFRSFWEMVEFYLIDYRMPLGSFKVYFLEGLLYPLRTVLLVTPFIMSLCDGGGLKISIETIVNRDWTPSQKAELPEASGASSRG